VAWLASDIERWLEERAAERGGSRWLDEGADEHDRDRRRAPARPHEASAKLNGARAEPVDALGGDVDRLR
jgi:hypothetical protein